jgi:hypothetical protein
MMAASNEVIIKRWRASRYHTRQHYDMELALTIEDFLRIKTTAKEDKGGKISWLTDDQINIPLVLLTETEGRSQVLIVGTTAAQGLFAIGMNNEKDAIEGAIEDFTGQHPLLYTALKDESLRWIVVPCSDGMLATVTVPDPEKDRSHHWGFMVIDKSKRDARWFDGALRLKRKKYKPEKLRIDHMWLAAGAAGLTLRGFDRLIGNKPKYFEARTLKYVPHDIDDNGCNDDEGSACGPYMYAMLHYLLKHPSYLENPGRTFVRRRWDHHVKQMKFNSLVTRVDMQHIISQEAEKNQLPGELAYRLTVPVIKALGLQVLPVLSLILEIGAPATLAPLTVPHRTGKLPSQRYRESNVPKGPVPSISGLVGESWAEASFKGIPLSLLEPHCPEDQEWNRDTLKEAYETYVAIQKSVMDSRHTWGLHTKQRDLKYPEGIDKDNLPDFARISKAEITKWTEVHKDDQFKPATAVTLGEGMKRSILHSTYKQKTFREESEKSLKAYYQADENAFDEEDRKDKEKWKVKGNIADRLDATYLNLDVPLFPTLTVDRIDEWVERLYPKARALVTETAGELLYHRARGLLHRMFVGELDDMSAEDIAEWRGNDPSIMAEYKESDESAMIIMKILYEGKDVESVPFLKHSPLHWPDRKKRVLKGEKRKRVSDGGDSDGGDNDGGGSAPKKSKTKPSDPTSTAEFEEIPDEDLPASGGMGTTTDPKEIDWLTITDVDLKAYVTEEVKRDRRIGSNPNNYTYRAILLIQHRGSFRNGSQKGRENTWVYDTNVFSHGLTSSKRKLDVELQDDKSAKEKYMHLTIHPSPVEILKRLADTYEPEEAAPEEAAPPDEAAPPGKPASGDPGPKKPEPKEPASSKPAPGKKALGEPAPGKPVPGKSASSAAVSKTTVSNSTVSKTIVSNSTVSKTIVSNSTVSKITVSKTTASKTAASKGKVTKATKKGKTKKTSPKEKAKKAAALETAVSETAASETAVTKAPEKLPPADRTIEKLSLPELRRHVPNFTKVQGKFLDAWRKFNFPGPDPYAPMPKNPKAWEARKLLQRIYGGFGQLNDKDLTYWGNNEDSLKKLKAEHNGDPALIRKMLEDQTAEYAGIDLRGQKAFYSDIYLKTRVRFVDPDFVFDDELVDKEGGDKNTTDDAVADENISDDEDTPDNHATGAPTLNDAEGDEDNTPRDAEHDSTRGGSPATHESAQPDTIFISSEPPTDLESDEGATDANDQTWNGDD